MNWGKTIVGRTDIGKPFTYTDDVNGKTYTGKVEYEIYSHNIILTFTSDDELYTKELYSSPLVKNNYLFFKTVNSESMFPDDNVTAFVIGSADILDFDYVDDLKKPEDVRSMSTCLQLVMINKNCSVIDGGIDKDMSAFTKGYMNLFTKKEYLDCILLSFKSEYGDKQGKFLHFEITHGASDPTFLVIKFCLSDWFKSFASDIEINFDESVFRFLGDSYTEDEDYTIAPYRWILKRIDDEVKTFDLEYISFDRKANSLENVVGKIAYSVYGGGNSYTYSSVGPKSDKTIVETKLNFNMEPNTSEGLNIEYTYTREDTPVDLQVRYVDGDDVDQEFTDILSRSMCNDFCSLVRRIGAKTSCDEFNIYFDNGINGYVESDVFNIMSVNKKKLSIESPTVTFLLNKNDVTIESIHIVNDVNFGVIGSNIINVDQVYINSGSLSLFSYTNDETDPVVTINTKSNFSTDGNPIYIKPYVRFNLFTGEKSNDLTCSVKLNVEGNTFLYEPTKPRVEIKNFNTADIECDVDKYVSSSRVLRTSNVLNVNVISYSRNAYNRKNGPECLFERFMNVYIRDVVYEIPSDVNTEETKFEEGTLFRFLNGYINSRIDIADTTVSSYAGIDFNFMGITGSENVRLNLFNTTVSNNVGYLDFDDSSTFADIDIDSCNVCLDGLFNPQTERINIDRSKIYFSEPVSSINTKYLYCNKSQIQGKDIFICSNTSADTIDMTDTSIKAKTIGFECSEFKSLLRFTRCTIISDSKLYFYSSYIEIYQTAIYGSYFNYKTMSGKISPTVRVGSTGNVREFFSSGSVVYEPTYLGYNENMKKIYSAVSVENVYTNIGSFEYKPYTEKTVGVVSTVYIPDKVSSSIVSDSIVEMKVSYAPENKESHVIELSDSASLTASFPTNTKTTNYGKNKYSVRRN